VAAPAAEAGGVAELQADSIYPRHVSGICIPSSKGTRVMKKPSVLALALAVLLASAATAFAQDVRYNFDKQTDFSQFKTYKWVSLKGSQGLNPLVDMQIKAAVDTELTAKGLTKTEADTADLYVGYQGAISTEKQYTSFDTGWGYGPGWGGGWYGGGGGTSTGQTSTIYVGQIAVDMYQTGMKQLVWRGVASKTIDEKAKPEKQQKNLTKAMNKLFKNFPPPVKKS